MASGFLLSILPVSDFHTQAGAAGLQRYGEHFGCDHRDWRVLRLCGRADMQQQHEGQSTGAESLSGDGQNRHGRQLLRAHNTGQR